MITVGMLMAIVNGTVNPLMCIVFGQMTDSFIQDARLSKNHNISNPSECSSAGPLSNIIILIIILRFTSGENSTLEEDMQRYVFMPSRVTIDV